VISGPSGAGNASKESKYGRPASAPEDHRLGDFDLVEGSKVGEVFEAGSRLANFALGFFESPSLVACRPAIGAFCDQLGHGTAGPSELASVVGEALREGVQKLESETTRFARQVPRIEPLVRKVRRLLGHEELLGCPPNGRFTSPQAVHWAGDL